MPNMYEIIEGLCTQRGIRVGKLCADLGMRRSVLSDLKAGRTKALSIATTARIADYFGVSADYLLGTDKASSSDDVRPVSDAEIKLALFGEDCEITDEMYEEVKRFAYMVKLREEAERQKKGQRGNF